MKRLISSPPLLLPFSFLLQSKHGQYRLFVQNNSQGKTLPSSSDKTHGLTVTFTGSSSTSKREARSTPQRLG